MLQLKHFIYLTIVVIATMPSVATAMPRSTRNITRIDRIVGTDPVPIPVSTRYITTETTRLTENQSKIFIATLCDQFQGHKITATLLLHTNYKWNPSKGVVYYYIVDDQKKTEKQSLCSNTKQGTVDARATCTINSFSSSSNTLYLVTRVGTHDAEFSIDIEIAAKTSKKENLKEMKTRKANVTSHHDLHLENVASEYLTEVITLENSVKLDIEDTALLTATFCPRPQTNKYSIDSTITGTDGSSSFSQYICNKLPCKVDGPNIIKENKQQVPKNEINLGPETSGKLQIYVLVVCWAGIPDPDVPSGYAGEFMYSGEIVPIQ